jgi:trimeric autotransporter adhesin
MDSANPAANHAVPLPFTLMHPLPSRFVALLTPLLWACLALAFSNARAASTTAFTYQGHLRADPTIAHGAFDFRFVLYASPASGEPLTDPILLSGVPLHQGLFTVILDFGLDPFLHPNLWLDIAVRPHLEDIDFSGLEPRQPLTSVPFALHALHSAQAAQADLALNLPLNSVTAEHLVEASITADRLAPGQLVTSLNDLRDHVRLAVGPQLSLTTNDQTLTLDGQASWRLDGNAGTGFSQFVGTTDKQPLEIRVHNTQAFRFLPTGHPGVVNLLGGSRGNYIDPDVVGALIAGGGASYGDGGEYTNSVRASFASIGGGWANAIDATAASSFIGGGHSNRIHTFGFESVIGGGLNNHITADGWQATISGGSNNRVESTGYVATISGGSSNVAGSYYTTLGGGARNAIRSNARYATISGGGDNAIHENSFASVIGGGGDNRVLASSERSTIGGGKFNQVDTLSPNATIGGGFTNTIGPNAQAATIPGGHANRVEGSYALAAGRHAHALHPGSFVWADSTTADFPSTQDNQFSVRATGGVRFVSAVDPAGIPTSGVALEPGGGSWSSLSDRDAKDHFLPVDPRRILDQLAQLPIFSWNYKAQAPDIRHVGPTAQDFQSAFQLGADSRRITTVDANGVALAAIQGLHQVVVEKEARILELERQNQQLEQRLSALESAINAGNFH